jgi:hypothetical protein
MQTFVCVLTSLVFAAHALLGCGAHRTCEHRTAILADSAVRHAEHACRAHHEEHDEAPCDGDHESPDPCSHSVCSYVKAETQRVDLLNDTLALRAALTPVELQDDAAAAAVFQPVCLADISSTHLYVWHCALII